MIKAKTSLGEIEERLRRTLALVGEVGATFEAAMSPVVIADDATRPGSNQRRNRAWMDGANPTSAASFCTATWRATEVVIIDTIAVTASAGGEVAIRVCPAGTADPYALPTAVQFIERGVGINDAAPLVRGLSGTVAPAGVAGNTVGWMRVGTFSSILPVRICLPVGALLSMGTIAAFTGTLDICVMGRLY